MDELGNREPGPAAEEWGNRSIADDLEGRIRRGEIHDRLPTRADLARRYRVTEATVTAALIRLEERKLIRGVRGGRVYVVADEPGDEVGRL